MSNKDDTNELLKRFRQEYGKKYAFELSSPVLMDISKSPLNDERNVQVGDATTVVLHEEGKYVRYVDEKVSNDQVLRYRLVFKDKSDPDYREKEKSTHTSSPGVKKQVESGCLRLFYNQSVRNSENPPAGKTIVCVWENPNSPTVTKRLGITDESGNIYKMNSVYLNENSFTEAQRSRTKLREAFGDSKKLVNWAHGFYKTMRIKYNLEYDTVEKEYATAWVENTEGKMKFVTGREYAIAFYPVDILLSEKYSDKNRGVGDPSAILIPYRKTWFAGENPVSGATIFKAIPQLYKSGLHVTPGFFENLARIQRILAKLEMDKEFYHRCVDFNEQTANMFRTISAIWEVMLKAPAKDSHFAKAEPELKQRLTDQINWDRAFLHRFANYISPEPGAKIPETNDAHTDETIPVINRYDSFIDENKKIYEKNNKGHFDELIDHVRSPLIAQQLEALAAIKHFAINNRKAEEEFNKLREKRSENVHTKDRYSFVLPAYMYDKTLGEIEDYIREGNHIFVDTQKAVYTLTVSGNIKVNFTKDQGALHVDGDLHPLYIRYKDHTSEDKLEMTPDEETLLNDQTKQEVKEIFTNEVPFWDYLREDAPAIILQNALSIAASHPYRSSKWQKLMEEEILPMAVRWASLLDENDNMVLNQLFTREALQNHFPRTAGTNTYLSRIREEMSKQIRYEDLFSEQTVQNKHKDVEIADTRKLTWLFFNSNLKNLWVNQWGLPSNMQFILEQFFSNYMDWAKPVTKSKILSVRFNIIKMKMSIGLQKTTYLKKAGTTPNAVANIKPDTNGFRPVAGKVYDRQVAKHIDVHIIKKTKVKHVSKFDSLGEEADVDFSAPKVLSGAMSALGVLTATAELKEIVKSIKEKDKLGKNIEYEDIYKIIRVISDGVISASGIINCFDSIAKLKIVQKCEAAFLGFGPLIQATGVFIALRKSWIDEAENNEQHAFAKELINQTIPAFQVVGGASMQFNKLFGAKILAEKMAREGIEGAVAREAAKFISGQVVKSWAKILGFVGVAQLTYELIKFAEAMVDAKLKKMYPVFGISSAFGEQIHKALTEDDEFWYLGKIYRRRKVNLKSLKPSYGPTIKEIKTRSWEEMKAALDGDSVFGRTRSKIDGYYWKLDSEKAIPMLMELGLPVKLIKDLTNQESEEDVYRIYNMDMEKKYGLLQASVMNEIKAGEKSHYSETIEKWME